jgi:5-methylcytosine-specific restriction endonuclease McrA
MKQADDGLFSLVTLREFVTVALLGGRMPRSSVPCAGCGKPMVGGVGSLPAGKRMCHPCRRTNPQHLAKKKSEAAARDRVTYLARKVEKVCAQCGEMFQASGETVRCCSGTCGQLLRNAEGRGIGQFKTAEDREAARQAMWQRKNRRRRALKRRAKSERYDLAEIAERDGFTCGICSTLVDMLLRRPDRWSPTIDHIVPIFVGGDDTRANVQLAHFGCNSRKGAKVA